MIAYKVIQRCDGELISAGNIPNKMRVVYSTNKITRPSIKGSQLLVFKSAKRAKSFSLGLDTVGTTEVWQVEVPSLKKVKALVRVWLWGESTCNLRTIRDFWNTPLERLDIKDYSNFCDGAYQTPYLKLKKRVKDEA